MERLLLPALMFTLDGVPLIYNGMETGDTNESTGGALFAKQNISWQAKEHPELRNTYHDLSSNFATPIRRPPHSHVDWPQQLGRNQAGDFSARGYRQR